MKRRLLAVAILVLGTAAVLRADDSVNAILNDWKQGNTNAYAAVMNRRLAEDPTDIGGLLMRYFWVRVFEGYKLEGVTAVTNAIAKLRVQAEAFDGPKYAPLKPMLVIGLDIDQRFFTSELTEEKRALYARSVAAWHVADFMMLYARVFKALEEDGAFRTTPTTWSGDSSLYRVDEATTNCLVCVTNLWESGAITNISRIASARLALDANDRVGLLLKVDCARALRDAQAVTNDLPGLVVSLGTLTGAPFDALVPSFEEEAEDVLSAARYQLTLPPTEDPKLFFPGSEYPHVRLLEALLNNQ